MSGGGSNTDYTNREIDNSFYNTNNWHIKHLAAATCFGGRPPPSGFATNNSSIVIRIQFVVLK